MTADDWLADVAYRGLLDDVVANPDDDTPRLVMADWLEERGHDARSRFIRLQIERAGLSPHSRRARECIAEERPLLFTDEDEWLGRLKEMTTTVEWRRGFVEQAAMGVVQMMRNAAGLFSLTPLYHLHVLRLAQAKVTAADIAGLGALQRTRSLCLRGSGLGDERLSALLSSVGFPALEELDLTDASPGVRTLEALQELALPRLRSLSLFGHNRLVGELGRLGGYRLEEIDLSGGRWTWLEFGQLAGWPGLASIRRLTLASAYDVVGWPALFGSPGLGPLERLDLTRSALGADGAAALLAAPRLSSLKSLKLYSCQIGDEGVAALTGSGLLGVEELCLGENRVTASGAAALAAWPGLVSVRSLSLGANAINVAGLEALAASPHVGGLVSLDLSSTGLTRDAVPLLEELGRRAPSLAHLNLLGSGLGRPGLERLKKSPAFAGVLVWGCDTMTP